MSNSTDISQQIAQIDSRLAAIEDEKQFLVQQRQMLLAQYEAQLALHFNKYAPAEAKIALFLSYFKGRNDIYPFRWENKQGRSGYSPACQNEWIQGICDKPKIKCTDCPNQAFKLYDEQAVYSHLNGAQTIGIYPLLNDNTTHLLAADFDKEDWFETIVVFAKTCELLNIPYLLERSRSGNGGHVWIFFKEVVTAANARKLGIALLHKAMEQYPALSFDCFDRLFPNQDIMPEGGFGNLIALPLQLGPRQLGNSTFIEI